MLVTKCKSAVHVPGNLQMIADKMSCSEFPLICQKGYSSVLLMKTCTLINEAHHYALVIFECFMLKMVVCYS